MVASLMAALALMFGSPVGGDAYTWGTGGDAYTWGASPDHCSHTPMCRI